MANWKYVKIGDVCTVERGGSPRPIDKFITDDPNGINWIKIGDTDDSMYIIKTAQKIIPEGMKKSRYVQPGDFLLSNSMSFGRPYILRIEGCIHGGWLAISDFEDYYIPDFLYHILTSNKYQQIMRQKASSGGAVQNLNADIVRAIELPIVPIPIQHEIVRILDEFSVLTAEIIEQLTSEITARQKQYEYYRDKLLTFTEKTS